MGKCILHKETMDPAALLLMAATGKSVAYNKERGCWETVQGSETDENAGEKEEGPVSG